MANQFSPITYEIVKISFRAEECELLTQNYVNNHTLLEYICPYCKQHRKTTWNDWQQGVRCPCLSKYRNRYTDEQVHQLFKSDGYRLLSTFINIKTPMEYVCLNGHQGKMTFNNWLRGERCPCESNRMRITDELAHQSFESEGYILLSTFVNSRSHMKYICPNGYHGMIKWNNWQQGKRCPCPKCCKYPKSSSQEREIQSHIEVHHPDVQMFRNDRTMIINPLTGEYLELDVWMPGIKKAIEYGAAYYHNTEYSEYKKSVKVQHCLEHGIELIFIDHDEWVKNKDWNMIREFINKRI